MIVVHAYEQRGAPMDSTHEITQKKTKNRIRDWKGLLANESRKLKVLVFLEMLLVSGSMIFIQLGFIGIGSMGQYVGYLLALLAPIAIVAILLGKGLSTLYGLLSGTMLFVHAQIQPLDIFENFFVTPLNAMGLYTVMGFAIGLSFAIALRNNPTLPRFIVYSVIVAFITSVLATLIFLANSLVNIVFSVASSVTTIEEATSNYFSNHMALIIISMGELDVQICGDAGLIALAAIVSRLAIDYVSKNRNSKSVLFVFRAHLIVGVVLVFLSVQAGAFAAVTWHSQQTANIKMDDEMEFIKRNLDSRAKYSDKLIDAVDTESKSDEMLVNFIQMLFTEEFMGGYDLDDGTIALFDENQVVFSNSPTYQPGSTREEIFGKKDVGIPEQLAKDKTTRTMIYGVYNIDKLLEEYRSGVAGSTELGYMRACDAGEYTIVMALPASKVFEERSVAMLWATSLAFVLLVVVYVLAAQLLRRVMLDPIVRTNESLAKITDGDLNETVKETETVELASLSTGINSTVGSLKKLISEAERRNEKDLATAKAIQESALPSTFPPFPEIKDFDIFASMSAAKEVGGDFYDFCLVDDETLGFLIADVSGKGIPGALFMMVAKAEIENFLAGGMTPADAISSANKRLCANNDAGMFVTVWAATLNYKTGELTYVNAGHNPPLLRHNGKWEWMKKKCGLFLGTFETAKYKQVTTTIEHGDQLLLYTDGVNEAFSVDEEEYGNDRLEAFLADHNQMHPRELVRLLRADVAAWAEGAEQSDDVTILSLEYGVAPEATGTLTLPAEIDNIGKAMDLVMSELVRRLCPISIQNKVAVALEELLVNICRYAYANEDKPGDMQISYAYSTDPSAITVELRDQGIPFDPIKREDPTTPKDIREVKVGGLGIYMVKKSMDDFVYMRDGNSNVVVIKKGW